MGVDARHQDNVPAAHSPTPWHVADTGVGWEIHYGEWNHDLPHFTAEQSCRELPTNYKGRFDGGDVNIIVTAVNAHKDLLAALERHESLLAEILEHGADNLNAVAVENLKAETRAAIVAATEQATTSWTS